MHSTCLHTCTPHALIIYLHLKHYTSIHMYSAHTHAHIYMHIHMLTCMYRCHTYMYTDMLRYTYLNAHMNTYTQACTMLPHTSICSHIYTLYLNAHTLVQMSHKFTHINLYHCTTHIYEGRRAGGEKGQVRRGEGREEKRREER